MHSLSLLQKDNLLQFFLMELKDLSTCIVNTMAADVLAT